MRMVTSYNVNINPMEIGEKMLVDIIRNNPDINYGVNNKL